MVTAMRWTLGVQVIVAILFALADGMHAQSPASQSRFYPDDPLVAEPTPLPVENLHRRALSTVLETIGSNLKTVGQRHPPNGVIPAGGVNTLGEVMDGDWYVNRHATHRMTMDELQRGRRTDRPPGADGPWRVLIVKKFGVNPGLLVADARNNLYVLRFDPRGYEGLATGAQVVSSRFFHALGYHVGESYLVRFDRARLVLHPQGEAVSSAGRRRAIAAADIDRFLDDVPQGAGRTYRAVATWLPDVNEALLGPYQVWGTRSDDPNDTVLHEHRRDLRGMHVFAAWLNFTGVRAVVTQDVVLTVGGVPRIQHFIADFTKSLGSGAFDGAKLAWEGNETILPKRGEIGRNIAGLGIVTPAWMKEKHPDLPEVGVFGSSAFDPEAWTPTDPMAPFLNRLPDDTFWAARQVMAFTDEEIRAIVQTGEYSKPAEDWIAATLIERRNRIGREYFGRVLPLDRIRVSGGALAFDDLGVTYGLAAQRTYTIEWYGFDNATDRVLLAPIGTGPQVPADALALPPGSYVAARVHTGAAAMTVTAYLRRQADGFQVVGIDRSWPGKVIASPSAPPRADRRVYADLAPRQRELFATYAESYNATRGSRYTPEESFSRLSVSEQTTFYGITHALMHSDLTDANGAPLGKAIDRLVGVERIAGQYAGKGGDEQFRLYVTLNPGTRQVLEKSREFFLDHENSVYHIGFPYSFRQAGKEPNIQFSMSEDGLRADIDVDYRSSRSPQALFNGHLTSSNSDVRAGENPKLHNGRWTGLVPWWQDVFGKLKTSLPKQTDLLNADRPLGPPTPLPPDRPSGAAPEKIEDAAQEFLTDWLVRHQYSQALEFLSPKAYACLNLTTDARGQALDAPGARRELRTLIEYAGKKLGTRPDLTGVIAAIVPRVPNRTIVDHAFRREFLLGPVPESEARQYLCSQAAAPPAGTDYYGAIFQFRTEGGGVLGLLWTREEGRWKIVSYRLFNP
jgi:hypothetical protein